MRGWGKCKGVGFGGFGLILIAKVRVCDRFVWKATADVEERLSLETGELKSDISNLGKKLHYLETTYKNSRDHIDKIVNSGGRS